MKMFTKFFASLVLIFFVFLGATLTNHVLAQSNVIISEVESNPPGSDSGNEWIKIYNTSDTNIDLSGWQVKTTHGKTNTPVISGGILKSGEYVVISFSGQFLDNEDEAVILLDSAGNIVDKTQIINDKGNDSSTWKRPFSPKIEKPKGPTSVETQVKPTEKTQIPNWIKNNAKWWADGQVGDSDFVSGIQYLIEKGIMKISETKQVSSSSEGIPSWIKNNAGWWADGMISDDDFVKGIQYLISNGIMKISTTDDIGLCQGTKLCITGTVEKIVDGDTLYVNGEKIRLSLTNTPEKDEEGYYEAIDFTSTLCPVDSVIIVDQDDKQPYDVYKRIVGKVYCGQKILNAELLYNNHANILTQYCSKSEFSTEEWAKKYGC